MAISISSLNDIEKVVLDLEVILKIDGNDYEKKDINVIINDVKKRILKQYHIDLIEYKLDDEVLSEGRNRESVVLFIDNVARCHEKLTAYLHIVRYKKEVKVKPVKIAYAGLEEESLMSVLRRLCSEKTMKSAEQAIEVLKHNMAYIDKCLEKRIMLIMIIAYELGIYELCAACAEVLYLGNQLN